MHGAVGHLGVTLQHPPPPPPEAGDHPEPPWRPSWYRPKSRPRKGAGSALIDTMGLEL